MMRRFWALRVFILWMCGLGLIGLMRGWALWHEREVLFELNSTLSPTTLTAICSLFGLSGAALLAAAGGLWWKQDWARQVGRTAIPVYLIIVQAYTWLFTRSGLMWERRGIALILAVLGSALGVGALTWQTTRIWLGLNDAISLSQRSPGRR